MRQRYERGFTLLEVIATISLILIIMSMAVPMYTNIVDKQKIKTDIATAMQLSQCAKTYYVETKDTDIKKLEKYILEIFEEIPESKYLKEKFSVKFEEKKPTVTVGNVLFVDKGKPKDPSDIQNENLSDK